MFDAPLDVLPVWTGVALASLAVAGVALAVQPTPAPDAASIANTVDATAADPDPAVGRHPVRADRVRLGTHRIGIATDGRRDYAVFRYGPITPAAPGTVLWEVAMGAPPDQVFESPAAFETAIERARDRSPKWRPPADELAVRTVRWEGANATIVAV